MKLYMLSHHVIFAENMESTESPLDVLSRAATMVQGNSLLPSYGMSEKIYIFVI